MDAAQANTVTIGDVFRNDRERRGLSYRQYGDFLDGISHVSARNLEHGRVSMRFLRRLAASSRAELKSLAHAAVRALYAEIVG